MAHAIYSKQSVKKPRVDKGPQPLMFNPALTTQGELPRRGKRRPTGGCASERMKTQRFSYFAFGADRAIGASTECKKLEKVAFSHFFDSITYYLFTTFMGAPSRNAFTLATVASIIR